MPAEAGIGKAASAKAGRPVRRPGDRAGSATGVLEHLMVVVMVVIGLFTEVGLPVAFDGPAPLHGPVAPNRRLPMRPSMIVVTLGDPVAFVVPVVAMVSIVMVMPTSIVLVGEQMAIRAHGGGASRPWIASPRLGDAGRGAGIALLQARRGLAHGEESEQANEHYPGHTAFHGQATLYRKRRYGDRAAGTGGAGPTETLEGTSYATPSWNESSASNRAARRTGARSGPAGALDLERTRTSRLLP